MWLIRTAESIDNRSREDQLVEETTHLLSRARLSRILHQWRDYSISSVAMRLARGRADTHHSAVLKRTCFSAWWGHNRRKLRVTLLTRQGEWFMRNRLLSAAYSQWRVQVQYLNLSSTCSSAHDRNLNMCIIAYYVFYRPYLEFELLNLGRILYLSGFHHITCLLTDFNYLLLQFMHSLVLKQASVGALWHWSEVLQRRCLAAWFLHTLERRRKRERYSQALERHRKRLVTIGVSQWIKVSVFCTLGYIINWKTSCARIVRAYMYIAIRTNYCIMQTTVQCSCVHVRGMRMSRECDMDKPLCVCVSVSV